MHLNSTQIPLKRIQAGGYPGDRRRISQTSSRLWEDNQGSRESPELLLQGTHGSMKRAVNTHCTIFQEGLSQGQRERRAGKYNTWASGNLHVVGGKRVELALLAPGSHSHLPNEQANGYTAGLVVQRPLFPGQGPLESEANGRKGKLQFRKKVCNPDCHDVR